MDQDDGAIVERVLAGDRDALARCSLVANGHATNREGEGLAHYRTNPVGAVFAGAGWPRHESRRVDLGPLAHESRWGIEPVFGTPSLRWRRAPLRDLARDGALGHVEAKLEEFAMDSWSALERVRDGHAGDPDDLIYCDGSGDGGIDLACLRRAEPARVSRPPRLTLRYPPLIVHGCQAGAFA
jgi:hypothetical protein